MTDYIEYRSQMRTGDVIAFSGKGRVSEIIKWKTGSPYSHVGLVLEVDLYGGIGDAVFLIESTTLSNLPDIKTGEFREGVQLHFLSNRVDSYDGEIWWVPLKDGLSQTAEFKLQKWLRGKHQSRTKYDNFQVFGAGLDLFDWIPGLEMEPDFSSLFCSELVMKALQMAGVVSDDINPSEQTPDDVVKYSCFDNVIKIKE